MTMKDTARALLDAHVRHELDGFRGDALSRMVETEVSSLFSWLEDVRLHDVSGVDQIMGVIDRCVIDFRVSGGIAELAGESASKVFSSKRNADARVDEVFPHSFFGEFADKAVGLEPARRDLLDQISKSQTYRIVIARLLQRGIMDLLFRPRAAGDGRGRLLAHLGVGFARRLVPDLERFVADSLARALERNTDRLAAFSKEILLDVVDEAFIRDAADDAWEVLAPMRLAELFAHIDTYDLEDFIVIGYEFWLKYRKTPYFRGVTREVVEHFFEKYGEDSVRSLIEDMGVDEQMVVMEAFAFLKPIVEHALVSGYLEARIRSRFEGFYTSDAVSEILNDLP